MSCLDGWAKPWAAVAAHEAGHAIAFKKAGIRIERIMINADCSGYTEIDHTIPAPEKRLGLLVGVMTGIEAQALYLKRYHGYSLDKGRKEASGLCDDVAVFREFVQGTGVTQGKARSKAESLVKSEWSRIERLADRIARKGTVSGSSI